MMISKRSKRKLNWAARMNASKRVGALAFDYLIVVDVEATCEKGRSPDSFAHEIIEFPAVLVRCSDGEITDEFHAYVKPLVNTTLSTFCTELTGISQEQVDSATVLEDVLLRFDEWINSHSLSFKSASEDEPLESQLDGEQGNEEEEGGGDQPPDEALPQPALTFALATDGPWDLNHFLGTECERVGGSLEEWHSRQPMLHSWVNLRWLHASFYNKPRMGISACLKFHKLEFEGRPHSGIDDSRNIARIASLLLRDGCTMPINDGLAEDMAVAWRWNRRKKSSSKGSLAARAKGRGQSRQARKSERAEIHLAKPAKGAQGAPGCKESSSSSALTVREVEAALLL